MITRVTGVLLFILIPLFHFAQTTRTVQARVIAIVPLGSQAYSIIQESGTENYYKTSPHGKNELIRDQVVSINFHKEDETKIEVIAPNLESRLYCQPIKSSKDLTTNSKTIERGDERGVSSPFPFCETDNNPIGGGDGYLDIITPFDADIYITTFTNADDFRDQIESANDGDIIYIADHLIIDLTGIASYGEGGAIEIAHNITIASGRGNTGGAIIKTDDYSYQHVSGDENGAPIFRVLMPNVRFTGLRFVGPYSGTEPLYVGSDTIYRNKRAIHLEGYGTTIADNLEVDNCEFSAFPYNAISIAGSSGISQSFNNNNIHHNYIHHNRQNGYGYGVHVNYGFAKVYANIFEANRHDIAGTGKVSSGYEAYCNTILTGGRSHNFDMHDEGEGSGGKHTIRAGKFIYIHHNDFLDAGESRYTNQPSQNIFLRGRPDVQCRIENNRFKHATDGAAVKQQSGVGGYGNILIWNNIYDTKEYKTWYVKENWSHFAASNFIILTYSTQGLLTPPPSPPPPLPPVSAYNYAYTFGDYNGDGKTDIYKLENNVLYVMPLDISSNGYNQNWIYLQYITYPFSSLRFGNFNADIKTDIIVQAGNIIYISNAATGSWTPLLYTGYPLSDLRTGDFDGNGITDLFLADGSQWKVSFDSNTNWSTINYSGYLSSNLRFGKFDTNNKTDVFTSDGTYFLVSYNGTTTWNAINNTGYNINVLNLGDFNGDGKSDVIRTDRYVSISGLTLWKPCNTDEFPVSTFSFGNF